MFFFNSCDVIVLSVESLFRSDSDLIYRRTLLGYDAEGMHANFQ